MKKLTAIVAAILLLVGIFPFAACSPDEETEEPVTGVYSAYPVLDAGFETEYETSPVGTEPGGIIPSKTGCCPTISRGQASSRRRASTA